MIVLTTENLILRPFRPGDAADVYEYSQSPNVGPNAGWKPHESLEESRCIMGEIFLDQSSMWGITLKPDDKVIGSIGLVADAKRQNNSVMMLGYALGEQYWGRGIAGEAARAVIKYGFEELDLTMISCNCFPFNQRSKRVIEKCGFHYEGTLRQAERIYDGKVYDHLCYSLTRKEYQKESGHFESAERADAMDKISFAQVARPDQIQEIVEMAGRIWHQHYDPMLPAGQVDYMLEKYQSDAAIRKQLIDGDIYFLMEYEGWSVGYSSVKVDDGTLFISKVYVYKDWRGKRLFSALLDMYEHYCRANGLAMMWLSVNRNNKESIAIYEHMGFVKEKKQITDIGNGYVMDDYIMVKRLNEGV